MADETDTNEIVETAAPETTPEPKKQRATRRPKAAAELAPPTASVKSPKLPRQKRSKNVEANPVVVETPAVAKSTAKTAVKGIRKAKASIQAEPTLPVTASDEMGDLLQLEEENKKLRKALSEKLRAENADLRKRLGQA